MIFWSPYLTGFGKSKKIDIEKRLNERPHYPEQARKPKLPFYKRWFTKKPK